MKTLIDVEELRKFVLPDSLITMRLLHNGKLDEMRTFTYFVRPNTGSKFWYYKEIAQEKGRFAWTEKKEGRVYA